MASIPTATDPHPVRSPQGEVPRLREVAVVVPVRNEEALLPACVRHLGAALDRLADSRPAVGGSVLLLLDACTDASGDIARVAAAADPRFAWAAVCERSVGRVRAEGARRVLRRALRGAPGTGGTAAAGRSAPAGRAAAMGGAAASGLWLASTDADTRVPVHWLEAMVAHADAGADAVLGTVEPDAEELDPGRLAHWRARHRLGDGHPFIHGANLGVRASAYLQAGGFPPVAAHEDVRLVEALRARGARIVASGGVHAVTSARFDGRAPQGFAGYLERLG